MSILTRALMLVIASVSILVHCEGQSLQTFGSPEEKELINGELKRYENLHSQYSTSSLASAWLDVTYYKLDLRVLTAPFSLSGIVTIRGTCNQDSPRTLAFDLTNTMHIDSVTLRGIKANFNQQPSSFTVIIDSNYHIGDILVLEVYYGGIPQPTGLGSIVNSSHSGIPWVWTLSEPYGARDWWPCKDHPSDKADSVDIFVTCDSSFKVGSNGKLESVSTNGDGTRTTFWKERYPISTYLVSIALTNYAEFSNWFHYSTTDSMEVLNYVLPERLDSARKYLPVAVDGLEIFSKMFGLYPFVNEKYGHAQFLGGAMEHQTMTSITNINMGSEGTIIHELAHQWFGDMITCGSWAHLWLNEGFATYSTALYEEQKNGIAAYRSFMSRQMDLARSAKGSVFARDTADVRELFNNARVYAKGSSVLHMLRHVLGDSVFFQSMYAHANDSSLKFKTALTEDFRRVCEQTSGKNLGYFFDEWIYGENYPFYYYFWSTNDSAGRKTVSVTISQTTGTANPSFFTMPIDLRLKGPTWDSTLTIYNDAPKQTFSFAVPGDIDTVQLDPGNWILKRIGQSTIPSAYILLQNYPNPFNAGTEIIYTLPRRSTVSLTVFNLLGQKVATLFSGTQFVGTYVTRWEPANSPSGLYFYRLDAAATGEPGMATSQVGKMILLK